VKSFDDLLAGSDAAQNLLALAWALHQPCIDTVLVGGRTPAHLDQAFAAMAFDDSALFSELEIAG